MQCIDKCETRHEALLVEQDKLHLLLMLRFAKYLRPGRSHTTTSKASLQQELDVSQGQAAAQISLSSEAVSDANHSEPGANNPTASASQAGAPDSDQAPENLQPADLPVSQAVLSGEKNQGTAAEVQTPAPSLQMQASNHPGTQLLRNFYGQVLLCYRWCGLMHYVSVCWAQNLAPLLTLGSSIKQTCSRLLC